MKPKTKEQLLLELEELRAQLDEAEDTLRAIRSGEVDALVVSGLGGEQVFTLKGADKSYRVLIEDMNEGALTMTMDGVILYSNRCFAEMLKTPLERVIGSTISTWIAHDSQDILQVLLPQDGTETRRHREITLLAGDGALVPGHLSTSFLQMEETQKLFCLVVSDLSESKHNEALTASEKLAQGLLIDSNQARRALLSVIEDQKQAEDTIHKLNETLEQRVLQRTADLERANKELESFSYSISHDLRAPLRHISGFAELLIDQNSPQLNEAGVRYLHIISKASVDMGNLIDSLLIFSRLSRAEVKRTNINSRNLVNRVIDSFNDEISGRDVVINISELPDINGDTILINQVWVNLISNAVKYTRKKEKAVIEIGGKTENGGTVFYIKDNGAGFNMKYADKLFGVFQRLHKEKEFEGIGIGLANVSRIVTRHKGKCWAESEVGKGAAFFFSIPDN